MAITTPTTMTDLPPFMKDVAHLGGGWYRCFVDCYGTSVYIEGPAFELIARAHKIRSEVEREMVDDKDCPF